VDVKDGGVRGYLSDLAPRLMAEALKRDVLLRPIGNVIYILPPYCAGQDDLNRIYDVIEEIVGAF
jgi:adenosylmethionine-8-amino-7-oxononanoate aminotransferase